MTEDQKKRRNECAKENRQYKKARHLCVRCGKQDAYTLIGRSYCYECCEKNKEHKPSKAVLEKHNLHRRKKCRENIESGMCPICGKRKSENGYKICSICRAKRARKKANYRLQNGIIPRCLFDEVDRCKVCGKKEVVQGYKVCSRCLENARRSIKIANSSRTKPNSFEKSIHNYYKNLERTKK